MAASVFDGVPASPVRAVGAIARYDAQRQADEPNLPLAGRLVSFKLQNDTRLASTADALPGNSATAASTGGQPGARVEPGSTRTGVGNDTPGFAQLSARLRAADGLPVILEAVESRPDARQVVLQGAGLRLVVSTDRPLPQGARVAITLAEPAASSDEATAPPRLTLVPVGNEGIDETAAPRTNALAAALPAAAGATARAADNSPAGVTTRFSPGAQLAATLSQEETGAAKAIQLPRTAVPNDTAGLAHALKQSTQQSGLFYESHLKAWTEGRYPLDQIRREPQAQLDRDASTRPSEAALQQLDRDTPALAEPKLRELVSAQLQVLEHPQLNLRGEWRALPFHLAIEPDEEQASQQPSGASEDETGAWRFKLRIDSPNAGALDISLSLRDARTAALNLEAPADSPLTQTSALENLRNALNALGIDRLQLDTRRLSDT